MPTESKKGKVSESTTGATTHCFSLIMFPGIVMSDATRRSSTAARPIENRSGQEEQTDEDCCIQHYTEQQTRDRSVMLLRAPWVIPSLDPVVSTSQANSPHQTMFGLLEGLPGRSLTYKDRPHDLASPSLATCPSLNPMTNNCLTIPYQAPLGASRFALGSPNRPPFFFSTAEFPSLAPKPQRLDSVAYPSLALEQGLAMARRYVLLQSPSPVTNLLSSDEILLSQLAAAAINPVLHHRQLGMASPWLGVRAPIATPSAYPPNQWPSVGLVGDTKACSPYPPRPQPVTSTSPVAHTSALSLAARVAELALSFSKEAGCFIPLVRGPASFPMVLHRTLVELGLIPDGRHIATFLSDGRSFRINNQALFEQMILPTFFPNMKDFSSFRRQLNLYDFRRVAGAGPDRGAYRHKLFVRDHPAMSCRMRRNKIKGLCPRGLPK